MANINDIEEKRLDEIDYKRHQWEVNIRFERKKDDRKVPKTHKSFNDEVLRELYDDFGENKWSDASSDVSWISYPPLNSKLVYENPFLMTKAQYFADKIKSKF